METWEVCNLGKCPSSPWWSITTLIRRKRAFSWENQKIDTITKSNLRNEKKDTVELLQG